MIFWGTDIAENTQGLDILGIRALDQSLEANLVNGVTTVSARGRYFSILPWAINTFYVMALDRSRPFAMDELATFLTRVEFLIIAASQADPSRNAGGAILGSDVFLEEMKAIAAGQDVPLPESKSSRILNTYYNPCKGLGLLDDGKVGSPVPYQLTDRGKALWKARQATLSDDSIVECLFDGGVLTKDQATRVVDSFSLGSMDARSDEAALLREAFGNPWTTSPSLQPQLDQRYRRFEETRSWIQNWASNGRASANRLLARNLDACCKQEQGSPVSLAWADYEWRRRHHFALELLLSSVCGLLQDTDTASPKELVEEARADFLRDPAALTDLWPEASQAWYRSARDAAASVPVDLMAGRALPFPAFSELRASHRLLGAFALVCALDKQTRPFREFGLGSPARSTSDLALELIMTADETPFETFIGIFMERCAIIPHLQVTLRKMSGGQKCSLRFFPDGQRLRLTANQSGAGFSNSRLDNTINILVDIGVFKRGANGELSAVVSA
jgi:hypothetical protein